MSAEQIGSTHRHECHPAFVGDGVCVVRHDNERCEGGHRPCGQCRTEYLLSTPNALLNDFWRDVAQWRQAHEHRDD